MAFFRHSPEVLAKMHAYPKFASLSNFLSLAPIVVDAEESEFSHYMFSEETSFTFLTFDAMVFTQDPQVLSYGPTGGVFYAWLTSMSSLSSPSKHLQLAELAWSDRTTPIAPLFSDEGTETEAVVHTDGSLYKNPLWFDGKWATFVETGWTSRQEREQRAFIMRREPGGPITQRLEPRERFLLVNGEVRVEECLYKHWKDEKREGESLSIYFERVWNTDLVSSTMVPPFVAGPTTRRDVCPSRRVEVC